MIAVDYIILAILIISSIMGLVRGLLREAIAVITWFLAIVLAWSFPLRHRSWRGHIVADGRDDEGVVRNHYATLWPDAWAAARRAAW